MNSFQIIFITLLLQFIPKEVDSTPDRKVKVTTIANLWSPKMALDFFAGCVGGKF